MYFLYCILFVFKLYFLLLNISSIKSTGVNDRIDCRILVNRNDVEENECHRRDCVWKEEETELVPWCFFDENMGYEVDSQTKNADSILAELSTRYIDNKEVNCERFSPLYMKVSYVTEKIVRIKITPKSTTRYEVPIQEEFQIPWYIEETGKSKKYTVDIQKEDASIVVKRTDNNVKLIDTSIGGLIFCDKFLQFATYLPNDTAYYGFGDNHHTTFKHDLFYKTYPIFTRDRYLENSDSNFYGHHPFMMGVQQDGKSFGIFFLNSNAMAYTFLPSPALSLKTIGGVLDVFVFIGDNPEEVVSLYTSVIGRPVIPPFWALGFQNCRWSYKNTEELNKTIQRNLKHKVPLDVQHMDIDYMDHRRDFTYDSENFRDLPELIKQTKRDHNLKWSLVLDPAIEADSSHKNRAFTEGYKNDVFIKWPEDIAKNIKFPDGVPTDKNVLYGKSRPYGPVAFPDFFKSSTITWWKSMIGEMHKDLQFDGLWLNKNEPSTDNEPQEYSCPNDLSYEIDPMHFKEKINTNTICLNALQGENDEFRHFDVHSLYGLSQSKATIDGLRETTKKRGFIASRSTFPSSGKYVAHWFDDNSANWEGLRQSIVLMMEYSLFGIPFTGADICGFWLEPSSELCRRWFQLGAFYPLARSNNREVSKEQDPGWWADNGYPEVTESAVEALRVRYQLLHYYYTAFYHANQKGQTVVRPMHHVFVDDLTSRSNQEQFFIGSSLMIAPFLWPDKTQIDVYVPGLNWYILQDDFVAKVKSVHEHITFKDEYSDHPILFHGGSIVPIVSVDELPDFLNTVSLRKAPISLWILPNHEVASTGSLFYDDGESIGTIEHGNYAYYEFKFEKCVLEIFVRHQGLLFSHVEPLLLKEILIPLGSDTLTGVRTDNIKVKVEDPDVDTRTIVDDKHNIRIHFSKPVNMIKDLTQTMKITLSNKDSSSDNCFIH